MGIGLSLYTVSQLARITVPTFAEAVAGRVTRDACDRRIERFARTVIESAEIDLDVRGLDRVPDGPAYVFMSNHQSHIDIPVVYATVPARTLRMVAKAELFRIPMWGRAMRAAEMVEVDRGDRRRAIDSLERAARAVESGVSIWIAPEGSRSRTGELLPLKKGGFHLARKTGAPIVPIAISGTREILPPGGRSMARGRSVRVVYGAPLPVEGANVADLRATVARFLADNVVRAQA
jgi:1-acyl-sn-glycerol-3-phosphate acyltransferase